MTISKTTIILAGVAAFAVLAVWMIVVQKRDSVTPPPPSQSSAYQTQTKEEGNVTVIVTPQEIATGKPATFQIVFDTHSVTLDFNVAGETELRDEKGNTYGVPVWSGDPPGGHHRKGTLTFPKPMKQASNVTLTLKDIAGVNERTFVWKLGASL